MKPLELIIYPSRGPEPRQIESGIGAVIRHRKESAGDIARAKSKRFTGAELAAEYWRSRQRWVHGLYTNLHATEVDCDARAYTFKQITRMTVEAQILERFATLPHYDEVTP